MHTGRLWGCLILAVGCGGASPAVQTNAPAPGAAASAPGDGTNRGASAEDAVELCHDNGGPRRTDYAFISAYECPDGSTPLGVDVARAAQARLGNIGEGPDGHVIDVYEVPCPSGAVRVHVDAYHCADRNVDLDPNAMTPRQLFGMAEAGQGTPGHAFDPTAVERREALAAWASQSPQVDLDVCQSVIALFAHRSYEHGRALWLQYQVSMMMATVLGPEGQQPVAIQLAGVRGALQLHDAIVSERGAAAADPALSELLRARDEGGLDEQVRQAYAGCHVAPGMMMQRDGEPVWPPTGEGCEALVRCCEGQGYVRNGMAVSGEPNGMMCLLMAASADERGCTEGLEGLILQGASCEP